MHGYGLVKKLCAELKDFMKTHNFSSIEDFRGYRLLSKNSILFKIEIAEHDLERRLLTCYSAFFVRVSLAYFTTHTDLVQRQQEAIRQRKAAKKGLQSDKDWTGDGFVKETESMVSN